MTAQVPDTYLYEGKEYSIVAMSKRINFNPLKYGIDPQWTCTACWTGYSVDYSVEDSKLLLKRLWISKSASGYPDVNGIKVKKLEKSGIFSYVYENVNITINYTGKIVIGNGFIDKYYTHTAFMSQRPWAYDKALELIFEKGILVDVLDHSETVRAVREEIDADRNIDEYFKYWWI